jgi:hypothetical protein
MIEGQPETPRQLFCNRTQIAKKLSRRFRLTFDHQHTLAEFANIFFPNV